ncbi:MAG: hypothetical protein AB6733_18100 [Clostridiaceae bacterium]
MEILSLGQKLKRARVYKGYTLKDICEDKISVSKLSCIENDKIKPEPWILKHICDKLKLSIEYLSENVKEQIMNQIYDLNTNQRDYIDKLEYYLEITKENNYLDLSYKIMQLIFSYYLSINNLNKCYDLIPSYYDIANKADATKYIYNLDMGEFILKNNEHNEAYVYFNNVIAILNEKNIIDDEALFRALSKKIICLLHLKRYDEAIGMLDIINQFENKNLKSEYVILLYTLTAILLLLESNDINKFKTIENKIYPLVNDDLNMLIEVRFKIAHFLYLIEYYTEGLGYMNELNKALNTYCIEVPLKVSLLNIELLIKNDEKEKSLELCDKILDFAIKKQDDEHIEKLYYYKGRILKNMSNYTSAEIYYNLSLDLLTKTNKNKEIGERYFEIGCLYNQMGNTKDAIKYINTSISIKNKI